MFFDNSNIKSEDEENSISTHDEGRMNRKWNIEMCDEMNNTENINNNYENVLKMKNEKKHGPTYIKGPWTHDEDNKLRTLVSLYSGKNWSDIGRLMGTRIGKQCRERWHNHLNPGINKQPFSLEENIMIYKLHDIFGNKWSEISKYLPGRTDNSIKNQWNSSLQKEYIRKRSMSAVSNKDIVKIVEKLYYNNENTQPTNPNPVQPEFNHHKPHLPKPSTKPYNLKNLNTLAYHASIQRIPIRKSIDGSNLFQRKTPQPSFQPYTNNKKSIFQFQPVPMNTKFGQQHKVFFNDTQKNETKEPSSEIEKENKHFDSWSEDEENLKNILTDIASSKS
ncbi:myb-like DNA-binding domain containing protein [Spraguea lophii 42_110]|uniref:Myb-like DNA-binding domain containing protein n=1 Tax=Spraguea lophii (strain 42_110) TaxID=1358809 RepID=S7XJK9_SPRLO|nr:myb-like DNA-binding domain containing protein [Spraguea lophii 42_110]